MARRQLLPPRVLSRANDSATGSYPPVSRVSVDARTGRWASRFDDTLTVAFTTGTADVLWPLLLKSGSQHVPISGSQVYQAGIVASGTVRAGVADAFVVPEVPVQFLRFDESLDCTANDAAAADDPFHQTGSRIEDLGFGFRSPLRSKTRIVIDLVPNSSCSLRGSTTEGTNYPMGYFNFAQRRFEPIGRGAVGNGNLSEFFGSGTYGFNVSAGSSLADTEAAVKQRGMPILNFGFPFHPKFHATASQLLHLSGVLDRPFLLEKFEYEFSASYAPLSADIDAIISFFILNQRQPTSLDLRWISAGAGGTADVFLTASLPTSISLSANGPVTTVDTLRDIVTFGRVASFQSGSEAAIVARFADLNILTGLVGSLATWTGSFVLSASAVSPTLNTQMGTIRTLATSASITSYVFGGRNGLGTSTGRDFRTSVVGFLATGSYTQDSTTLAPNSTQVFANPYVLFPSDKLVFGWQTPLIYSTPRPEFVVCPGKGRLVLYGSQLREGVEVHDPLNQLLTSPSVHENCFGLPIQDQWDTEMREQFQSGTLGDFVTGSMSLNRRVLVQTCVASSSYSSIRFAYDNDETARSKCRGFLRGLRLQSTSERFYDTFLPRPDSITVIDGGRVLSASYAGGAVSNIIRLGSPSGEFVDVTGYTDSHWPRAFPFEPRYSTVDRVQGPISYTVDAFGAIRRNRFTRYNPSHGGSGDDALFGETTSDYPNDEVYAKFYYGIGHAASGTAETTSRTSVTSGFQVLGAAIRGWKYGLINGLPLFSSAVWRRDRFGQARDMLEQRLDSRFYDAEGLDGAGERVLVPGVRDPVTVCRFVSDGDTVNPYETSLSNMSVHCTSSLPYFDDVARNR